MKNTKIILSCLISTLLVATASAAWVPLTGNPVSINSLPGGSLIFGDKMLSEITVFGIATGGAIAPDACSVFVQGGQDDVTGDYGLKFNLVWTVGPDQIINATLDFKVSILPGYDDYFIKDVWLDITGASANGTGVVNVGEDVRDEFNNPIVLLSCSAWQDSPAAYLKDYAEFTPVKAIWIHSKDVSISGGDSGSAHLSEFYQYYSQIPEPATLVLLGTMGIWIFTRKKRPA